MRVTYAKKDSQQIICLKGVSAEVQKRREEEREKRRRKKMAQRAAAVAAALQAANQSVNGPVCFNHYYCFLYMIIKTI